MTVKLDSSNAILRSRFGAWIKERREALGYTQLEMSSKVNYAYAAMVSQIERGASALPPHDLRLWAEVLEVKHDEFAMTYLYYCQPFIYQCLTGKDPYVSERLPKAPKTVMSAPGRPSVRRARDAH